MRFDNLDAVRARIDEIERKFSELGLERNASNSSGNSGISFVQALQHAKEKTTIPCPDELNSVISKVGDKYGIEPAVIKAVIRVESGFRSDAVSRVGAKGLMQLMPGTAQALGVDPMNAEQCIDGGTRYLKQMIDRFGSLELGLAAYNSGPGSVSRYNGIPPYDETRRYVNNVLRYMYDYSSE